MARQEDEPMDDADFDEEDILDDQDDDEFEVEDPLELMTRLFQTDDGDNICDVLTNINDSIQQQTNVLKVIAKLLQQQVPRNSLKK